MIDELIFDPEILSLRSGEIDTRKENADVRAANVKLKNALKELNVLALAGIQIGIPRRLFVINYSGKLRCYVNPMILEVGGGFTLDRETDPCLPDRTFIVFRYNKITMGYSTPMGAIEYVNLAGKAACVAQQMCDYMEGVQICDIGLEIDEEFDNATDEEKAEILKAFIDSLEVKEREAKDAVQADTDLAKVDENIRFETALHEGTVTLAEGADLDAINDARELAQAEKEKQAEPEKENEQVE